MNKPISCILLRPYAAFQDGTQGAILVLNWQSANPAVFLFNSLDRQEGKPNCKNHSLLLSEAQMLSACIKGAEQENHYLPGSKLKEAYSQYGAVRLCPSFISAHVADMIGVHLNERHLQYPIDTSRTQERLAGARIRYTNYALEDELLDHMDDGSIWSRDILAQTLPILDPTYNHEEWLKSMLVAVRTAFTDILKNMSAEVGVDFGQRLISAYHLHKSTSWWRVLEITASMKYKEELKYSEYGFQEILAFYGLAQHIADHPFDNFTIGVSPIPLPKRIEIFSTFRENVVKECLTELQNADNPFLSSMPTKQDAQKAAKELIHQNMGRVPEWLPEASRKDFSSYEYAFCSRDGIVGFDKSKEKKNQFAKERAGIKAVYESGLCKHKADWGAVFKILTEREIYNSSAYNAVAEFINTICGIKVTDKDSLRQSPAMNILGGNAESGWKNRDPENRESGGKLLLYRKIAESFFSAF